MSDTGSSDDGDDYGFADSQMPESRRYPVHDCCEFEDAEALRRLIFIPYDDSDNEDDSEERSRQGNGSRSSSGDSSSSDENDSAAAAHAAAIGHSPQPLPAKVMVPSSAEKMAKVGDGEKRLDEEERSTAQVESSEDTDKAVSRETKAEEESFQQENKDESTAMAISPEGPSKAAVSENGSKENDSAGIANGELSTPPGHNATSTSKKKKPQFYCPHNLNERDNDENTPIHIAIHNRKLEHVKLLVEAGASIHKKSDGSPPIHTAISLGSLPKHAKFAYECVVFLTENGADLAAKDDALYTPLYLACMYNLPHVVSYILSTDSGSQTLNTRADRSGGRALHAAAKFDTLSNLHIHKDGNSIQRMPGFPGKPSAQLPTKALLTQVLLGTPGIEIDATNSVGQTPLHVACSRGQWDVVKLLLEAGASPDIADRRGFTPGQHAHKRGMPIPNDLLEVLGGPPLSGEVAPPRDLIVDPDRNTLLLTHELCVLHRTCSIIRRDSNSEPPPENVRRLHVLVDQETGILRTGEFTRCTWENETRRAAMVDVLKCHEYNYVETISQMCSSIPDHPSAVAHLDADTTMSRWSFEAALRAAGSVCEAVDKVVSGDFRNAFCAVRPPGHHAGPRGIVRCANDPDGGSHGFCFLNNVAIGAAYARSMYRNEGIRKIAIVDFDVHHGNGTEEIIRQLVPNVEKSIIRTPFAVGELAAPRYRPWLDESDVNDVFFVSTHGYGPRGIEFVDSPQGGWFYPASGKTQTSDAIKNPSMVESPNLTDFLLSQTWTRMGEDARGNCCKILNCGLGLPDRDAIPGTQRLELRDTYRQRILPRLREFDPDIIFVSAGFDAHKKDTMNFGYVGMVEDDYEWVTEQLVRIANTCCNGRIVSVLEGGYKIHGGIVSPFARSVAAHVRALADGGRSRELYDLQDGEWESQFERHLVDERERKRQQKLEKLRMMEQTEEDQNSRKRKRNQVDYRVLYEQMKREGFAS